MGVKGPPYFPSALLVVQCPDKRVCRTFAGYKSMDSKPMLTTAKIMEIYNIIIVIAVLSC